MEYFHPYHIPDRSSQNVGTGLKRLVGVQEATEVTNVLECFPERKPDLIAISDYSGIAPCSYVNVKSHVLTRLEDSKEEESADNAERLDQIRRAVINQSKTCLEDDDMAGLNLHLMNFDKSFSKFPEDQLRDQWGIFCRPMSGSL